MARYGKKAQQKVEKVMRERKKGTLRSGGSGKKVTSRKQAIAIGLSEARRAGGKVPSRSSRGKRAKTSGARGKSTGGASRGRRGGRGRARGGSRSGSRSSAS
jgi:hypothetical protein